MLLFAQGRRSLLAGKQAKARVPSQPVCKKGSGGNHRECHGAQSRDVFQKMGQALVIFEWEEASFRVETQT